MAVNNKYRALTAGLLTSLALATNSYAQQPARSNSSTACYDTEQQNRNKLMLPYQERYLLIDANYHPCNQRGNDNKQNPVPTSVTQRPAQSAQTARAQQDTAQKQRKQTIYSTGDLTMICNGVLASSYIKNVPNGPFSLRRYFRSNSPIHYDVTDAQTGLENIAEKRKDDNECKNYIESMAQRIGHNDARSLRILNRVLHDGIITRQEYTNSVRRGVRPGTYMARAMTTTDTVPVLLNFMFYHPTAAQRARTDSITNARRARAYADSITNRARVDSIGRESRRIAEQRAARAAQQERIRDSTAAAERAKARADSIARARAQAAGPEFHPPREMARHYAEFGPEITVGKNGEISAGLSGNTKIAPWLPVRLGIYGYYSGLRGNPFPFDPVTSTLRRDQLFMPGTYEIRTDLKTTTGGERGIWEIGGRVYVEPWNWLDLVGIAGEKHFNVEKIITENSNTTVIRNQKDTLSNSNISNSQTERTRDQRFLWGIGLEFKLSHNMHLGGEYVNAGNGNHQVRFKGRWDF